MRSTPINVSKELHDIISSINVSKEISLLAEHHKDILESRFPDHDYEYFSYQDDCIRLVISERDDRDAIFLIVSFSSSSIRIAIPFAGMSTLDAGHYFILIDYADPKFTDDTVSDILKRLGR